MAGTGTHEVMVDPAQNATGTYSWTLSTPVTSAIAFEGPSVSITPTRKGQDAILSFYGYARQVLSMTVDSTATGPAQIAVKRPNNTWQFFTVSGVGDAVLGSLPATGNYDIIINPNGLQTGGYTASLFWPTGVMQNGASRTLTILPNATASRQFLAFPNQQLSFGMYAPGAGQTRVGISDTLEAEIAWWPPAFSVDPNQDVDWLRYTQTGVHTLNMDPYGTTTGTYTLTLSTPISLNMPIDSATATAAITRSGQDIRLEFDGTQGQYLSLGVNAPGAKQTAITLYRDDGSTNPQIATFSPNFSSQPQSDFDLAALPTSAHYWLVLDPDFNGTGSYTMTLSSPVTGNLSINGSPSVVTITRPGQDALLSFTGSQSQVLTLTLPSATASVVVYNPDGSTLNTTGSGAAIRFNALPTTGTYQVRVDPDSNATGVYTISLSEPVNPAGNLAPSGTGNRWAGMSTATANTGRVATTGINDTLTNVDIDLNNGADDAASKYEAAGVIWSSNQTVGTVKFINGSHDGNGVFAANLVLQTYNGSTWSNAPVTWTLSPSYPYSASADGQTYVYTGGPISVRGVRVVGQVNVSGNTSKRARIREVQAFAAQNASAPMLQTAIGKHGGGKVLYRVEQPKMQMQSPQNPCERFGFTTGLSTGCKATSYYTLGGKPVAMREQTAANATGVVYYLHGDHLGGTNMVTNQSGQKVGEMRYMPFGETRSQSGDTRTDRLFTGQRSEASLFVGSLMDFKARTYSTVLGRFLSADTIVPNPTNAQSFNRYSYVRNKVMNLTDPTGHCASDDVACNTAADQVKSEMGNAYLSASEVFEHKTA